MISHHLPDFPTFKPFSIDDMAWYQEFYSNFQPYSDFHFYNLLLWLNSKNDLHYSSLNGNIVYRFGDPFGDNQEQEYTILGNIDIENTMIECLRWLKSNGHSAKLVMVPEELVTNVENGATIQYTEDIDNNDYILDGPKTAHLSGSDLRSLREDCNSFIRRNGDEVIIKDFDLNSINSTVLINNLHLWDEVYTKTGNDSELHESHALNTLFKNVDALDFKCLCIYIKGVLEGFVLYHYPPQKDFVMSSIVKVSYRYQDLYDFCVFAYANRASRIETKYINFEQDLGIPGLRNYKKSLKPVKYLRRYTVELA